VFGVDEAFAFLGCQIEKAVDELNLTKKIISCHPSNLPLPDHVDCFVALNRSPSCLEFSEALLVSNILEQDHRAIERRVNGVALRSN